MVEGTRRVLEQSQSRQDIQLNKLIVHSRARAKFHPISDFLANLVESVSRRKTVAGALWIFATRGVTAAAVGLDFDLEPHEAT